MSTDPAAARMTEREARALVDLLSACGVPCEAYAVDPVQGAAVQSGLWGVEIVLPRGFAYATVLPIAAIERLYWLCDEADLMKRVTG